VNDTLMCIKKSIQPYVNFAPENRWSNQLTCKIAVKLTFVSIKCHIETLLHLAQTARLDFVSHRNMLCQFTVVIFTRSFVLCAALMLHTARTDSPPLKRRCVEEPSDSTSSPEDEVSDIVYGEIARLHHRFVVSIDPSQHPSSKVISLLCRLGKSAETGNIICRLTFGISELLTFVAVTDPLMYE